MNNQEYGALTLSVRQDVESTLRSYDEVHITFQNGEYQVSTSIALLGKYPDDFKVIGDVSKHDIYTTEEQVVNYIETFHDYPPEYKGYRDYDMLRFLKDSRKIGEDRKIRLENGTAKLVI